MLIQTKFSNETNEKYNTVCCLNWEAGAHTEFSKNIYDTLKKSIFCGMTVTQFFFGSPKSFMRHRATQEDIDKCKKLLDRFPLHVFSHFPYISNLAGSVKQLAWSGDKEQDAKTQNIINELEYELSVLSNFSIYGKKSGVVIHPGNYKDESLGLAAIAKSINKINFTKGSTLLLENSAGQGCVLAKTFKEIKKIIDQVLPKNQKHIGVCVDTAHICGMGEYDLSKCSEVVRMFEEFDQTIGMNKFTLLHLNDSVVPLGSKKDEHALLGTGHIWNYSFESLILLLNMCKKYEIPVMLETHGLDMLILGALSDSVNQV
jgi:deoxyribonuclease-4